MYLIVWKNASLSFSHILYIPACYIKWLGFCFFIIVLFTEVVLTVCLCLPIFDLRESLPAYLPTVEMIKDSVYFFRCTLLKHIYDVPFATFSHMPLDLLLLIPSEWRVLCQRPLCRICCLLSESIDYLL